MGWIGVDLFFVLSGYLVSSLLFREFIKTGSVRPVNFLIRRGFKIYPVFYFFLLLTLVFKICNGEAISWSYFFYESVFIRNYFGGIWAHTWSLCVEEHFYFLLAIIIYFAVVRGRIRNSKNINWFLIGIGITSLVLRVFCYYMEYYGGTNTFFNEWAVRVHTHNRIDSLAAGVFISYNINFQRAKFEMIYRKISPFLVIILPLLFLPHILNSKTIYFSPVILYTINYLFFGLFLMIALSQGTFLKGSYRLIRFFIKWVAKIGVYSYSIYLIHPMVAIYMIPEFFNSNKLLYFLFYVIVSLMLGMIISYTIENYFLRIRDKFFPAQT